MKHVDLSVIRALALIVMVSILGAGGFCPTPTEPPNCSVSTSSLDFGSVGVSSGYSERSFTIRNTGGGTLNGSVSDDSSHYYIVGGNVPYSLRAGEGKEIVVRFDPSSDGQYSCTISTGSACADIHCSGYGVQANNAPTVTILNCPADAISSYYTFYWSSSDNDGSVVGYYYDLDDSTPDTWTTSTSKTYNNMIDGNHTFYVKAKDNDGAYSTVATCSIIVDESSPPSVAIDNCPAETINSSYTFYWSGSDNDGSVVGYYYDLDDSTPDIWTTSTSKTYTDLSEGNHTFYVKAKDDDGNFSEVSGCAFQVGGQQPRELEYIDTYYLNMVNEYDGLEGISLGKYGNLVTVSPGDATDYDYDCIVRMHSPVNPSYPLIYEVDLPDNFVSSKSISFDGENILVGDCTYTAYASVLDGGEPDQVIYTGAMWNLVTDMCIGSRGSQTIAIQVREAWGDLAVYSVEHLGQYYEFNQLEWYNGDDVDFPWEWVYGVTIHQNAIYAVYRRVGEGLLDLVFARVDIDSYEEEEVWEFPSVPGISFAPTTGLVIFEGKVCIVTRPNEMHYLSFPD